MRIYGLVQDSIVDGPGFRFVCFVQGCPHHCPGCHNPDSHSPAGGKEMSVEAVGAELLKNPLTDGLTLSGGEPMDQAEDCLALGVREAYPQKDVWCYTGYLFEELRDGRVGEDSRALLEGLDVLVDGPFVEARKDLTLRFRGSSNQRIIDVPASLRAGQVVSWTEIE